jgi:diketogulonate reductase-like aldo/keto reductase
MPAPALAVLAEVRLNSGRNIPSIGFGTFLIPPGRATYDAVRTALGVGYRHLDTAQYYDNERGGHTRTWTSNRC